MSILDALLKGNERLIVGVSLTPGIGLEAVVLDKNKKSVVKYAKRDVKYNFSTREIENMVQFKGQLADLMSELGIAPKTDVYIVLPNILFDFIEAPPELSDDDIKTMILSKAEEFYLFKRDEPISGFCNVMNFNGGTQKKYAYTSFQKNTIDEIKQLVSELGFNLIGIESSYSATLRGLYLSGRADKPIIEAESWTIVLINTNSYVLFQMEGKNISNYTEKPLAIKSLSIEEAYQAIAQGVSQLLTGFISSKVFLISQADEISAEFLKKQMQINQEIVAIESNKYASSPVMPILNTIDPKGGNCLTLSAIGAASGNVDYELILNVLQGDPSIQSDTYELLISGKK